MASKNATAAAMEVDDVEPPLAWRKLEPVPRSAVVTEYKHGPRLVVRAMTQSRASWVARQQEHGVKSRQFIISRSGQGVGPDSLQPMNTATTASLRAPSFSLPTTTSTDIEVTSQSRSTYVTNTSELEQRTKNGITDQLKQTRVDHLIIHCTGTLPVHKSLLVKDERGTNRGAEYRAYVRSLRVHPDSRPVVTVITRPDTTVAELSGVLSILPMPHMALHLVGPLPKNLPPFVRTRQLILWDNDGADWLRDWIRADSAKLAILAIRFAFDASDEATSAALLSQCRAEHAVFLSIPVETQRECEAHELCPVLLPETLAVLWIDSIRHSAHLLLSCTLHEFPSLRNLQCLHLVLCPYHHDLGSISVWLRHVSTLFQTIMADPERTKHRSSLKFDLYLKVVTTGTPALETWLPSVLQGVSFHVFRAGLATTGSLHIMPDVQQTEEWVRSIRGWLPVLDHSVIRVAVHRVPLTMAYTCVVPFVNQYKYANTRVPVYQALGIAATDPAGLPPTHSVSPEAHHKQQFLAEATALMATVCQSVPSSGPGGSSTARPALPETEEDTWSMNSDMASDAYDGSSL